jgi:hypothetical protein
MEPGRSGTHRGLSDEKLSKEKIRRKLQRSRAWFQVEAVVVVVKKKKMMMMKGWREA